MVESTLGGHSLEGGNMKCQVRKDQLAVWRPLLPQSLPVCPRPPTFTFTLGKSWKIASGIFKVDMLHKDWDQNELTCDKWEGGNFCFVLPQAPKSCCIFSPKHQPEENIIKTITRLFRTIPSLIVLGKGWFWIIYVFMDIVCYSLPLPPSLPLLP